VSAVALKNHTNSCRTEVDIFVGSRFDKLKMEIPQTYAEYMEANPGMRLPEWAIKKVTNNKSQPPFL